jgi:4'-phosphopantetheinyl transferase
VASRTLDRVGARLLSASQIDVWLQRPELARTSSELLAVLPAHERARLTSFRTEAARRQHLVARALCRVALSRYAGLPADRLRLTVEAHGRPVLEPGQIDLDLRFSISHTTGLVACAVARGRDVGIDLEHVQVDLDASALAERFFSPREAQDVRDRPAPERTRRFLRYWTLKEAWLKARGVGLGSALPEAAFRLDDDGGDKNCLAGDDGEDGGWRFWQWCATPDHVLAVACDRGPARGPVELRVVESEPIP